MKYKPRYYQNDAFKAIGSDFDINGNSIVAMPTGSGKSFVIAMTAQIASEVLILQPTQELLAQNREKLLTLVDAEDVGTYSAAFKERTIKKYTFATIQSIYKKPELFSHIKLVIMDECHNLAPRKMTSMYTEFFRKMGNPKVIGFTATPYRLEVGYHRTEDGHLVASTMLKMLNRMRHKSANTTFWKRIIYTISHQELVEKGYLVPIEYMDQPLLPYHQIPVNQSRSDYNLEAYTRAIVGREAQIISTIGQAQKKYKSVLVFCSTTDQARHLSNVIVGSKTVFGDTDTKERRNIVSGFKSGAIKTVFNVGTLTTGFDHPDLDCIILLRPTRSIVLYNQILGRLTRTAPGKTKGTLIDFTETYKAVGRIETFKLFRNAKMLWDLKTEKHDSWHDRVLFSMVIEGK